VGRGNSGSKSVLLTFVCPLPISETRWSARLSVHRLEPQPSSDTLNQEPCNINIYDSYRIDSADIIADISTEIAS
jgi:hypothetical protein